MLRRKEAVADGAAPLALEAPAGDVEGAAAAAAGAAAAAAPEGAAEPAGDGAAAKFKPGVMFKVGA
jgi:hypothetical protein